MRNPNPELRSRLLDEALALVITNGNDGLSMRALATRCDVSATIIYYYWKDKAELLDALKMHCMEGMDAYIAGRARGFDGKSALVAGLRAFRDWALKNRETAMLVMSGFREDIDAPPERMARYYRSHSFAEEALRVAVAKGEARSDDPARDSALAIACVWGAIESLLRHRTLPELWDKETDFTDRAVDLILAWLTERK